MATPTVTNTTTSNLISNVDSGYLTNLIVSGTSSTSYEFIGGTDVTTTLGDTNSYITTGYNFINYNTNTPFGGFGKDGEIRIDPDTGECKFYIASKYKWVDCEILETKNSTDKDGKKITIFSISTFLLRKRFADISLSQIGMTLGRKKCVDGIRVEIFYSVFQNTLFPKILLQKSQLVKFSLFVSY
jgi:hypothetical protein